MPKRSFANTLAGWEELLAGVEANQEDLPYLVETCRKQLEAEMAYVKAAATRKAGLRAELHQVTRDLNSFLARGRDLAARIRAGARAQYGYRSEKLGEFGIKPSRKRKPARAAPFRRVEKEAPRNPTPR